MVDVKTIKTMQSAIKLGKPVADSPISSRRLFILQKISRISSPLALKKEGNECTAGRRISLWF